jgi:F-type H+-transporting ATPase subunit alpha
LLKNVPIEKIHDFEEEYISFLNLNHKDIMKRLAKGDYDDEIITVLTNVANELTKKYNN